MGSLPDERQGIGWKAQRLQHEEIKRLEATIERQRQALDVADEVIRWLGDNESAAMERIPTKLWQRLRRVGAALSEGDSK